MLLEARTGPAVSSDGAAGETRRGRFNELITNDLGLGRYAEAVLRGQVFWASTQSGIALTTTLSTTATGFILTNPVGSGKNLLLLDTVVALTSAPAGVATLAWAVQFNSPTVTAVTHTTPLTVRPALLSGGGAAGGGVGLADSAATLPNTPVALRAIPGGPVASGTLNAAFIRDEVSGLVIMAPGCSINTFALTTAISAVISVWWAEVVA